MFYFLLRRGRQWYLLSDDSVFGWVCAASAISVWVWLKFVYKLIEMMRKIPQNASMSTLCQPFLLVSSCKLSLCGSCKGFYLLLKTVLLPLSIPVIQRRRLPETMQNSRHQLLPGCQLCDIWQDSLPETQWYRRRFLVESIGLDQVWVFSYHKRMRGCAWLHHFW